jgi:hypothetical protein
MTLRHTIKVTALFASSPVAIIAAAVLSGGHKITVVLTAIASVVLVMWAGIRYTPAREQPAPPAAPLRIDTERLRTWGTADLIAVHDQGQRYENAGSPATLADDVLLAIEIELRRRGVPLCTCGAPLPDGIHAKTCPEKP